MFGIKGAYTLVLSMVALNNEDLNVSSSITTWAMAYGILLPPSPPVANRLAHAVVALRPITGVWWD